MHGHSQDLSGLFYFRWRKVLMIWNPSRLSFERTKDFLVTSQIMIYDRPFGHHTEHNIVYSYIEYYNIFAYSLPSVP